MLGVPIRDDSSDSQDLNRLIDTLIHRRGLSLPEAMELAVPPIVNEIRRFPEEIRGFYMYLRQVMGPFAQGPIALVARHGDECVFSVDALGLRPLWQIEAHDSYVFSSEPGVVPVSEMTGEPKPLAPGEKVLVRIKRDHGARLYDHQMMQRLVHTRWLARTDAARVAGFEQAIPTGGPLEGPEIPGYASAGPAEPVKVEDRVLAGMGWQREDVKLVQQMASNGAEPIGSLGYDGPLAALSGGAAEPRRLLQGDGRRGHQPGDRPRARDRALLLPRGVRRAALARAARFRAAHDRDRLPDHPRRASRHGAADRRGLPARRQGAQDLPGGGPVGGVPHPRRGDRHLLPRGGDGSGSARAAQVRGGQAGAGRRGAARAVRPHRLRGRPAVAGPASGAVGDRRRAARVPRRQGRGEPAPADVDRAALGRDPQRPRRRDGARPGSRRGVSVRDDRGDLRRRLRDGHLQHLLGAAKGHREGDLDARHPRGARLRAAVLVDRA